MLIPNLDADWKAVRRLSDAIAEAADHTVEWLMDEFNLDYDDEDAVNELTDRVITLATTGTNLALECSDCGLVVDTLHEARAHEDATDPNHGGWDTKEKTA